MCVCQHFFLAPNQIRPSLARQPAPRPSLAGVWTRAPHPSALGLLYLQLGHSGRALLLGPQAQGCCCLSANSGFRRRKRAKAKMSLYSSSVARPKLGWPAGQPAEKPLNIHEPRESSSRRLVKRVCRRCLLGLASFLLLLCPFSLAAAVVGLASLNHWAPLDTRRVACRDS